MVSTMLMLEVPVFSAVLPRGCTGGSRRARRLVNSTASLRSSIGSFPLSVAQCVRDSRSNVGSGSCCHIRMHTVLDQSAVGR